jgi:hypothetical protein
MSTNLGVVNVKLGLDASRYERGINGAKNLLASIGVGFSTAGIVAELRTAYLALEESDRVNRVLESTLKATGNAAGLTSSEIQNLANNFMNLTGVDDEVIKGAQTILLTFRNIGRDVFPETTKAVMDMATVMGTDLNSAALQVGKALNDPIQGMTALRRVGVAFTADQQKMIQELVRSGRGLEAQKIILEELKNEFGGAAEAGKTGSKEFATALGELQEAIGRFTSSGGGASLLSWSSNLINQWTVLIDQLQVMTTNMNQLKKLSQVQLFEKLSQNQGEQRKIRSGRIGAQEAARLIHLTQEEKQIDAQIDSLLKSGVKISSKPASPVFNMGKEKKGKSEEDKAKEAAEKVLNYKVSLLEKEKYYKQLTDKELLTIELKQYDLRLSNAKKYDLTEYNNLLSQKSSLILDHNKKVKDLEIQHQKELKDIRSQEIVNKLEVDNQALDDKSYYLQYEVTQNKISKQEQLAQEISFIDQKKHNIQKSINERLKLAKGDKAAELSVIQDGNRQLEQVNKESAQKSFEYWQESNKGLIALQDGITEGLSGEIRDLINGNLELANSFQAAFGVIRGAFADMASEMVKKWLQAHISMFTISKAVALKEAIANSFGAIVNAIKAVIGIPVVGPAIAPAAAASAVAMTAGSIAAISGLSIPVAHSGLKLPGTEEQLILAQGGERVLNRRETKEYEQGSQQPQQNVYVSFPNMQVLDSKDFKSHIKENMDYVRAEIDKANRQWR